MSEEFELIKRFEQDPILGKIAGQILWGNYCFEGPYSDVIKETDLCQELFGGKLCLMDDELVERFRREGFDPNIVVEEVFRV